MDGVVNPGLAPHEARRRAAGIRLVLTDCDGVLTDAGVYYGAEGEVLKRFSIRDGMGVELLGRAGIAAGIVTGERSESVRQRAAKLGLEHLYLGVDDKNAVLDRILSETGLRPSAVAYIGDDVNDETVMRRVAAEGLTGAPADAVAAIREIAHFVGTAAGGHGAFREFADRILALRTGS